MRRCLLFPGYVSKLQSQQLAGSRAVWESDMGWSCSYEGQGQRAQALELGKDEFCPEFSTNQL